MRKYVFLSALLLLSTISNAQTEWKWFNPNPDGFMLRSVWFFNETNAWAVGDNGKIIFWNGLSWTKQESNTENDLASVCFTDINHGWAVGKQGCILRYADGFWTDHSLPYDANLVCVALSSADDGWICGDTLLRLQNDSWTLFPGQDSLRFQDLSFTSPGNGWAIGQSVSDAYYFDGVNWQKNFSCSTEYQLVKIKFSDPLHGILAGRGGENGSLVSYNNGVLDEFTVSTYINSIYLIDSLHGYAAGNGGWWNIGDTKGHIYKYTNGNWDNDTVLNAPVYSIHGNQQLVWAVGASGIIYLKKDGIWKLVNSCTDQIIKHMSFPDSLHGWMIPEKDYIYKYNSGKLEPDTILPGYWIKDICFVDSATGFAIADATNSDDFYLLRYKNKKWTTDTISLSTVIRGMSVVDANHIWVISPHSIFFYNGSNWSVQYTNASPLYLEDINFANYNLGFVVGTNSYHASFILRYDGSAWNVLRDDLPPYMKQIGTADGQYCWTVNGYGRIYKFDIQTNEILEELPTEPFSSAHPYLQMISNNKGYVSGTYGILEYDGTNWSYIEDLPRIRYNTFDFTHPGYQWVGGDYGVLLSTYAQSTLTVPYSKETATEFGRSYPNPVAQESVVEFDVSKSCKVNVEIFDAYGRSIGILDDSYRQPGTYRLPVGNALQAAGIYVCRIIIGSKISTLKLVNSTSK